MSRRRRKQDRIDALCNCLEVANERNQNQLVCGVRTGHRLSIVSLVLPIGHSEPGPGTCYIFRCLDCFVKYQIYRNFTVREQELIDNLKQGVEK